MKIRDGDKISKPAYKSDTGKFHSLLCSWQNGSNFRSLLRKKSYVKI